MEINGSRNQQHDIAMGIIYQCLFLEGLNEDYDIVEVISDTCEIPFEDIDIYVRQVVVSAIAHKNEIKEKIKANLRNWRFERLSKVEVAILYLAYSHYVYVGDVDKKVVINVAVEQAKKFLDSNDYKFVNAILENILQ